MATGNYLAESRQQDVVDIGADGRHARGEFDCRVEVSIPHDVDNTLAARARLQGQYASSRWIEGHILVDCRREEGAWKISSLAFKA